MYDTQEDKSGFADLWFETFDEAVDYCIEKYKVIQDQWVVIKDPKEGQQHDIINYSTFAAQILKQTLDIAG